MIFVAEDELLIALLYKHFFEKKGFMVLGPFTTGQEAIQNFDSNGCKLALLDIQLEDKVSGIEVAEHIRKHSDIPIIFTTGNEAKLTIAKSEHISNVHVVPKPVDFQKIMEILEKSL